jgi:hypothetical protein
VDQAQQVEAEEEEEDEEDEEEKPPPARLEQGDEEAEGDVEHDETDDEMHDPALLPRRAPLCRSWARLIPPLTFPARLFSLILPFPRRNPPPASS